MKLNKKIFTASLLIAGTTIGAGMLALPIVTAVSGFMPSIIVFAICYLFMMATGLLLVEALSWYKGEFNLVSLATTLLGPFGKWLAWLLYLFLFYTLTVAYTAGGADILQGVFGLPKFLSEIIFVSSLAYVVMKGTKTVHSVNHYFMMGMILAYAGLMLSGWDALNFEYLKRAEYGSVLLGLPVVFTSFSYQGTIPSVKTYLNNDVKALKKAIIIGITIPFVIYVIWQSFIMGLVPYNYLIEAQSLGKSAVYPLEKQLNAPWVFKFGTLFAFFAITTSFLGVTLGLKDFIKDGLKIEKEKGQFFLMLLTFLPPFLIAQFSYNIFITALRFAGGIGCALLLGLMPIMMVWKGRYGLGHTCTSRYFLQSKLTLLALASFVIAEVLIELKFLFHS
jgi:tyrosine-specific transport protein